MKRLSIEEICIRYKNENLHTAHVTRLALSLFDQTHEYLKISPADRPLLEAACRLHDVGYLLDPRNHPRESASVVMNEGLAGFSSSQRNYIAAAILLHQRKYERVLKNPIIRNLSNQNRAIRLAAFLRVADGLDHSHIQDLQIEAVRIRKGTVHLQLSDHWYGGNIPRAEAKADLWRRIFPADIKFIYKSRPNGKPVFLGVVQTSDSVPEAARKLFYSLFRTIVDNRDDILLEENPDNLHDIRVAMRRFRTGLRFFGSFLKKTSARELGPMISALAKKMGPCRDADVLMEFVQKNNIHKKLAPIPEWEYFYKKEQIKRKSQIQKVRQALRSEMYGQLVGIMAFFLRIECSALIDNQKKREPIRHLSAEKLSGSFKRLMKHGKTIKPQSVERMHKLRIACKKERYYAEFSEPVFGNHLDKFVERIKAITRTLGNVHDMDVQLGKLKKKPVYPPEWKALLEKKRLSSFAEFEGAWRKLQDKRFCENFTRRWETIAKGE